jgi:hypothetical protein
MLELPKSTSAFMELDTTDIRKVIRLALVASIGLFLSELATKIPGLNFGVYQPAANLLGVVLTEVVRRYFTDNTKV